MVGLALLALVVVVTVIVDGPWGLIAVGQALAAAVVVDALADVARKHPH